MKKQNEDRMSNEEQLNCFLVIALLLLMIFYFGTGMAEAATQSKVRRTGDTFSIEQVKNAAGASKTPVATSYKFTDADGIAYPVYLSRNGRAYIVRTSKKTGNEYKKYLPEEISREICKELGVEYKEKSK